MSNEIWILAATAASIAFMHTLFGPDHYLPFIVLSKARKWSLFKTMGMTAFCGIGHVMSSVVIGMVGVSLGLAVTGMVGIEASLGTIVAWLFIGFGLAYFIWGVRRVWKNKEHDHTHTHRDGTTHEHIHNHKAGHAHLHEKKGSLHLTPWALFIIFVLGPCEPLIPILMYPASVAGLILVTAIFGIVTVSTMIAVVTMAYLGIDKISLKTRALERYTHPIAGATIFASGMAIQFMGL